MKLKIQRKKFDSGMYYYLIYEWFWFHWVRRSGLFDTLEEAEKDAVRILEDEREQRKSKKEKPVYYQLDGNTITYKKGDGVERFFMGEPPLKFKKNGEPEMTEYKCPKWEEVYTKELTLQALFEKLIDTENRMKDEVFILTERIDKLEGELK